MKGMRLLFAALLTGVALMGAGCIIAHPHGSHGGHGGGHYDGGHHHHDRGDYGYGGGSHGFRGN